MFVKKSIEILLYIIAPFVILLPVYGVSYLLAIVLFSRDNLELIRLICSTISFGTATLGVYCWTNKHNLSLSFKPSVVAINTVIFIAVGILLHTILFFIIPTSKITEIWNSTALNILAEYTKEHYSWLASIMNEPMIELIEAFIAMFIFPIFEEVFFRGTLLKEIKTRFNPISALIFTSLLFTLMHGGVQPNYFVIGIIFGGTYILTGRLIYAIGIHIGFNVSVFLIFVLAKIDQGFFDRFFDYSEKTNMYFLSIEVLFFTIIGLSAIALLYKSSIVSSLKKSISTLKECAKPTKECIEP